MGVSPNKLESVLIGEGYIKKADFDLAKEQAKRENTPLEKLLVDKGLIKEEVMGEIIARLFNCPYIKLKKTDIEDIPPQLLNYLPEKVALAQEAIIFKEENGTLYLATTNPTNYGLIKTLERRTKKKIKVFYATVFDIEKALKKYTGGLKVEAKKLIEEFEKDPQKSEENIVKLVNLILEYAYLSLASDIHIEPLSYTVFVRYRIDGILYKELEYPPELHIRVASRIKILARLRVDERAAPQDGHFTFKIRGAKIEVRVSTMPTADGENIVMRLLMPRARRFELDELGLLENDFNKIRRCIKKPYGMIICVGPTGSGKTTTLYASLQLLNKPEVNIMTIEDPIEYRIERIRQIQVNPKKGITFSTGLRNIVRQDPDIIMVGEIRDKETLDMAINSALTGHLVLTTMHANDAPTTFSRFLEVGAKPYLISACVNVIIAQRLVRTICKECREGYYLSEEEKKFIEEEPPLLRAILEISGKKSLSKVKFFRGKGCRFCNYSGYEGRTGIFEILEVTEEIRDLVSKKAPIDAIRNTAIRQGMTTMVQDGITKALIGVTTFEEVRRAAKV
ncbi:MAG: Flp pilus assembly complex ATPase component TadA [Candidatus Pacebacteria bacterium]|nr:Flp pilus assembly complex ATPase component TadA [Candidatus Paceibacterota bacterium]